MVAVQLQSLARSVREGDAEFGKRRPFLIGEFVGRVGRYQGHMGSVHAQKHRLVIAVRPGSDHAHVTVHHLISVADRAISQPPILQGTIVVRRIDAWAIVDHAGRQQHRARGDRPSARHGSEAIVCSIDPRHASVGDVNTELSRLITHALKQIGSANAAGIAGVIVRARYRRASALPVIDDPDREIEPGEIYRSGQPRWSRTDDEAVDHIIHHRSIAPNAAWFITDLIDLGRHRQNRTDLDQCAQRLPGGDVRRSIPSGSQPERSLQQIGS
jgi:hypothetical protein